MNICISSLSATNGSGQLNGTVLAAPGGAKHSHQQHHQQRRPSSISLVIIASRQHNNNCDHLPQQLSLITILTQQQSQPRPPILLPAEQQQHSDNKNHQHRTNQQLSHCSLYNNAKHGHSGNGRRQGFSKPLLPRRQQQLPQRPTTTKCRTTATIPEKSRLGPSYHHIHDNKSHPQPRLCQSNVRT
ncbi:uncharacterized protein ACN2A1_012715 isoform 1-T3 [Glossina fuscipes fuscipes]